MVEQQARRRVWDWPLRICHWALVLCVIGSYVTHELGLEWFAWHVRIGYATLVLVAFRIAWGVVGPRHARFSNFLRGPRATLEYVRGLARRDGHTTPGHNPLGALAVVAMLLLLAIQAVTGLFANDEILNTGPLYGHVDDATSDALTGIHHANFEWLLVLIGLHLAAMVFYAAWKRIDLVRPMVTGDKPARLVPPEEEIDGQRGWVAVALVAVFSAVLWWVVSRAPEASMAYY